MFVWSVENDEMKLNQFGKIVKDEWFKTAALRPNIELLDDEFVVMPNHIHGIIWINDILGNDANLDNSKKNYHTSYETNRRGAARCAPTGGQYGVMLPNSLPTIVRAFKSSVTKRINLLLNSSGSLVWQRNYYEHIISSEKDYENIADYISLNPLSWQTDKEYSD